MPSINHPTYYERSQGDAARTYEQTQFFRDLPADNGDDCGTTESPLGYVALMEVTWADIVAALPDPSTLADLAALDIEPGWYIVRTDDNGLVWAMSYGQGTYGEEQARADYAEAEKVSAAWDLAEDGIYETPCDNPGPDCADHNGTCD